MTLSDGSRHVPSWRRTGNEWDLAVLDPRASIAWQVVAGKSPVPASGTVIELEPPPGVVGPLLPSGRMDGSVLRVEGLLPDWMDSTAWAPDGTAAELVPPDERGEVESISFHPSAHVEVRLLRVGGAPVVGARVELRDRSTAWSHAVETSAPNRESVSNARRTARFTAIDWLRRKPPWVRRSLSSAAFSPTRCVNTLRSFRPAR